MTLDLTLSSADLTRQLCDIESVSGNEKDLADAIQSAISHYPHLEVVRDGDALVARTNLGRKSRVIIAGHLDTVPVNGNLPTRESVENGVGYLWGRGTVDMKAGVAVQLKLAVELTNPRYDVTWMWYDHEEVDSRLNGLGRLYEHHPDLFAAECAILGEPTNAIVEGGCNGTLRFQVRVPGIRAHSARSWVGDNAIHKSASVLNVLAEYVPESVLVDSLLYREGLNAVRISGGVAGNVIPDECVVEINYRFAPSKDVAAATGAVRALFAGYDLTVTDSAEGARPGLDRETVQEFVRAVDVQVAPKYGWTDVARFSTLGVPAVNYGPGDPLKAHADDERVQLDQIAAVENGLRTWLGTPSDG